MGYSSGIGTSELIDLLLSFVVLTIAFSMVGGGVGHVTAEGLAIVAVAVGSGFMLHELAHKFVAQRYGYWAEYKASMLGLVLTILMAMTIGIVFAAPGAVVIRRSQYSTPSIHYSEADDAYWDSLERRVGSEDLWISLAGPMTNIILVALAFASIMYMESALPVQALVGNLYYAIAIRAFQINLMLAAFNLIPIDPLDGGKVFRGNPLVWAAVGVPTILFALAVLFLGIYPF
ncbi:site-2 protease family protein [Methanocella conradii]|uniref:site-2 protease family protein n=1 Tax=Methanocella conradii TaxID=1175444 RepID=UPI0024B39720|nr:site-2 protease family protein [Methanocella conradii]MDI6897727.1 site-2 protease family protein [Methanocella conradii]